MFIIRILEQFFIWLQRQMRPDVFLIILATIIGILAGITSFLLKTFVYKIDQFITNFSIDITHLI